MQKCWLESASILRLYLHFLSCCTGGSEYNQKTLRSEPSTIQNTKQINIPPQNFFETVYFYEILQIMYNSSSSFLLALKWKILSGLFAFLTLQFRPRCWILTPKFLPAAEFCAKYHCACIYGVTQFTPVPLLDSRCNLNFSFTIH